MSGKFENKFISKLNGKISNDDLKVVMQELMLFAANYDITEKETSIIPYEDVVPDCYKVYLVTKKIEGTSPATLKTYNFYLMDFFEHIHRPYNQLTTNDIRLYLYEVQKRTNISNRTLDGKRLVINTFLDWCFNEGYIQSNPCAKIKPIKYQTKPREPLTDLELELIREACKTPRDKAIIENLYSTGARVSELVVLKKSDIDFQNKEVHLFGKGSKHRTSFINAKMEVALKKYFAIREDDCDSVIVRSNKPYTGLKKESIEKVVRDIGVRSGIGRPVYPHLIRHTTASSALNRGMNITEIQSMLGHSKIDTTMIYAKINNNEVKYNHQKYIV